MNREIEDDLVILGMYPLGSILCLYENEIPFGGHERWILENTISVQKPNNFDGEHTQGILTSNGNCSIVSICVYRRIK